VRRNRLGEFLNFVRDGGSIEILAGDGFAVRDIDDRFVSGQALTNLGDEFFIPGGVCGVVIEDFADDWNTAMSHTKANIELFEVAVTVAVVSFCDGE